MSFRAHSFREFIVAPTLRSLGMYSQAAENLLVMTSAQESQLGNYLRQVHGPAIGIDQMEPATHDDLWVNFIAARPAIAYQLRRFAGYRWVGNKIPATEMTGNLYYATAMTRVHYYRRPEALPDATDTLGLAKYYKRWYNTPKGAATIPEIMANYAKYGHTRVKS